MKKLLILVGILFLFCSSSCGNETHEHSFGEWEVVKEASCSQAGIKQSSCSCGEKKTETIKKLSHTEEVIAAVAPTCEEKGLTEGKKCSVCNAKIVEQEEISAIGHEYNEWEITKEATKDAEGEKKSICKNGCGKDKVLKILQTPNVIVYSNKLHWFSVNFADGYKLYKNGELLDDLGDVITYNLPLDVRDSYYQIEAYTFNPEYDSNSTLSNVVSVEVSADLQTKKTTDFENINGYRLTSAWNNEYANFSNGEIIITEDNENMYAKMYPNSTLTKACSLDILNIGTYTLSFSVKLSDTDIDTGRLFFNLYDGEWIFVNKIEIDISNINASEWVTINQDFIVPETRTATFINLDIEYASNSNCFMIDNIKISNSSNENFEISRNYDFESFSGISNLNNVGWYTSDNKDIIYINNTSIEHSLVKDGENTVVKAYGSDISCSIDFSGNVLIAETGTYLMSIKVKLGSEASNVNNIGFRFFSNVDLGTSDYMFDGLEQLTADEWVTLSAYFTVNSTGQATYVNINFWFFTHNDEVNSINNYVLVDDVSVYKVGVSY